MHGHCFSAFETWLHQEQEKLLGNNCRTWSPYKLKAQETKSTKGLKSMTTDGFQSFFLFLASSFRRIRRERHDGRESEKAKQAVVLVRLVKMAASRRLQKQPECKMFGAPPGPTWWRGRQLQWLFGLTFSGDLFPVGEIWLKIVWGCDSKNPCVFFWWACGLPGHPSGSRQAYWLLGERLWLKTERGRTKIPLAAESKQIPDRIPSIPCQSYSI